ncbi:helix-turn-helix domain-containing protein [Streptomyces sp. NPDC058249]|uniref:helix-turn-helix domain-containing protein n=1 Tax=Streptomyces sp. NPDC058249 TaxID=3346403 RepID=UPI0036E1DCBF
MSTRDDVEEFAALLRRLKARTDRSYGALARRLNMNTSTLHRYCAGDAVPLDFAPVERFATMCGATPAERIELHRMWILAVAARQRGRTSGAPGTSATRTPETETSAPEASAPEAPEPVEDDAPAATATATTLPGPSPANRAPWYRRRVALTAAVVTALLATLGSLSALSADRSSAGRDRASGGSSATAPGASSPKASGGRHGSPTPSASSSASAGGGRSSGTTSPKAPGAGRGSASPSARSSAGSPTAAPLSWTADSQLWQLGCSHDYVIDKSPEQVPPPPAPQDAETWAKTQSAVHGHETLVEISVQGRTDTAVVLEALRVRVVGRTAPAQGTVYAMDQGCGGDITPRSFAVDLDVDRPIAHPVPGSDTGRTVPARSLPYRVSAKDPEVLLVDARTEKCDCRWYLELDWSSQGHSGTLRIDDHGRPFRTSGIKGLPHYWYSGHRWTPLTG